MDAESLSWNSLAGGANGTIQLLNIRKEGAGIGWQPLCEGFICYNHSWVGPKQSPEKVREKGWIQHMEQLMSKAAEGGG